MDIHYIIDAYNDGESMNSIAKKLHTYPTTIKRILEKNGVVLRHDVSREGALTVRDGEKLIEWAKKQDRLVTKAELAAILGKTKLSPSYFLKYPELGQYIKTHEQKELHTYTNKLYDWLKRNGISYKPADRTKLGVTVDALLLGEYSNIALQILEKPRCISRKNFTDRMQLKINRAEKAGILLLLLEKEQVDNLDDTMLLEVLKKRKKKV